MASLQLIINTINVTMDIPACTTVQEIQEPTLNDTRLQGLKTFVIGGWSSSRADKTGHTTILEIQR